MSRQVLESVAAALDVAADVVAGSGVVVVGTVVVVGSDVISFGVVVVDCLVVVVGSGVVGSGVVGDCGVLVAASAAVADVTGTTVERADVSILAVARSSVVGAVDRRGEQKGPVTVNHSEKLDVSIA